MISIVQTPGSIQSNDHRRVSALQKIVADDPAIKDLRYAAFDEGANNQWAILDPKGAIKSDPLDGRKSASVNFGDTITLGVSVWVEGSTQMNYLSCRENSQVRSGLIVRRRVSVAPAASDWEKWTIIDPVNPTSTRQVNTDDAFALKSAFGDYLSRETDSTYRVLRTAPTLGEAERWIAGVPVVADCKRLRGQNLISVVKEGPKQSHLVAPEDISKNARFDQSPLSASNRWTVVSPADLTAKSLVKFGDTVCLRVDKFTGNTAMAPASLYLSYRQDRPLAGGGAAVGVADAPREWELWKIVDPYSAASVESVRFGDKVAFKGLAGGGGYLSLKNSGAATSSSLGTDEIWTLGDAVTEMKGTMPALGSPNITDNSAIMLNMGDSLAKTAVVKGVAFLPEVGPVVSGLVAVMWPKDGTDIWAMIQERVKALVGSMIEDASIATFVTTMSGLKNEMREFILTQDIGMKGAVLNRMLGNLDEASPAALALPKPQQSLPHLVNLATIHLNVLHERFINHLRYFPNATPDDVQNSRHDLKEMIVTYLDAVQKAKAAALVWRKGLVDEGWVKEDRLVVFKDDYVPNNAVFACKPYTENKSFEEHRQRVADIFATQLEAIMLPSLLWRYLDPDCDEMPTRGYAILTTGPFGKLGNAERGNGNGGRGIHVGQRFWNEEGAKPLRKIGAHSGDSIYMLQINDGPQHGSENPQTDTITLGDGERIVSATGHHGWECHQITFTTNKSRTMRTGRVEGATWTAAPPPETDPQLWSLSGNASDRLDNLYLNWQYRRWE
jgi:hypothetical protein